MKNSEIHAVVDKLVLLMDRCGGWSYDTYDVRVGPVYQFLAQRRHLTCARYMLFGLYALELLAPICYRKVRGIPRTWDPMGNSYRAGVELTMFVSDGRQARLEKARTILDDVRKRAVGNQGRRGFALGFPCITGSNKLWKTTVPVAHYTVRVARKLLLWESIVKDSRYTDILAENIEFLLQELPWVTRDGCVGVAYTPEDPLHVINIWADVASLLAAYDRRYGDSRCRERALALTRSVIKHQSANGSFPYYADWENKPGEEDNSHTAMVLGALADVALCYPEVGESVRGALEIGVASWIEMFFDESNGRHWNMVCRPGDPFTVCLGDALYAINRLLRPDVGLSAILATRLRTLEERTIRWSIDTLRLPSGHFCERRLPFKRYALNSIRSFDGLICDALSLYMSRRKLGDAAVLWTT